MKKCQAVLPIFAALVFALPLTALADPPKTEEVLLTFVIYRANTNGGKKDSKFQVLANPHLATCMGRPAQFVSGASRAGLDEKEFLTDGLRFTFKPMEAGQGKIRVILEVEYARSTENKEQNALVQINKAIIDRTVAPGEKKKVSFGKIDDQPSWLEFSVR